jgi:protoheme IX farnesyltransferase
MLPVVKGSRATRNQIVVYTLLLTAAAAAPYTLNLAGPVYGIAALIGSVGFIVFTLLLWRASQDAERTAALRVFAYSIAYLFALFTALAAEKLIGFAPAAA